MSHSQKNDDAVFYALLESVQLESFYTLLRDKLQITRISHFDYVKTKDLEQAGMSKPAIRRLLDAVEKHHTTSPVAPARPPPLPPSLPCSSPTDNNGQIVTEILADHSRNVKSNPEPFFSKLSTSTLTKNIIGTKLSNFHFNSSKSATTKNGNENEPSSPLTKPVSFLINPADLQICRNPRTDKEEELGSGQFGIVKKAVWTTHTSQKMTVAVKCLRSKMLDGGEENQKSRQSLLADVINEVTSMCGLEHKHLIKLHGIVLNSANSLTSMLMMVTEYAPFGSLESYLRSTDGPTALPVKQLFSYTYQIANGMSYLESRGLIHRDLATRNILLLTLEHVKICDFGMSRSVAHFDSNASSTDYAGQKIPCAWYPPESIRARVFSAKSDVWSFGVTVWEVFTGGEQPWPRMTAEAILDKIERESERLPQPDFCSQSFYKIMLKCWSEVAAQRPSFKELEEMIQEIQIIQMKAKASFKQEGKLEVNEEDCVTIIDGAPDRFWWKGQNNRTRLVGLFPRTILDNPQHRGRISTKDISNPLSNSFIHTGHMSAKSDERSWGHPGKIDEIFLRNPVQPPDLLDDLKRSDRKSENAESSRKSTSGSTEVNELAEIVNSMNLIDLSSENMRANGINVCHPNYFETFEVTEPAPVTANQPPVFTKPDVYDAIRNSGLQPVPFSNYQYNTSTVQEPILPKQHGYYNELTSITGIGSGSYVNTNYNTASTSLKSTNPFTAPLVSEPSNAPPPLPPLIRNSYYSNTSSSSLGSFRSMANGSPVSGSAQAVVEPPPEQQTDSQSTPTSAQAKLQFFANPAVKRTSDVDELLSKVMKDVIVDLDNLKSNVYK